MFVLRCEGVTKTYGGVSALKNVSLEIADRSIVAIIGPNGAGKTTLLNVLTGFTRPESGRWYLDGTELTGSSPDRAARLGVVRSFQDLRLISEMPVLDNVMLAQYRSKGETVLTALLVAGAMSEERQRRREARVLLKSFGLLGLESALVGELSYGQQKLLSLACCAATSARILLFDEPVAGLDPEVAEEVLKKLEMLREDGRGILFVEHDMGAVRRIAERVVVMDEGSVICEGDPMEVLERPEIMEAFVK